MQDQMQEIRNKVNQCLTLAEQKFGIKMPPVDIRFDLTGAAAGMAGHGRGQFILRFNVNHIKLGGKTYSHLLNETVPHEVAHTVCQAFPQFGRNHDAGWKRVCIALGGNGLRCYNAEDAPEAIEALRPWVYITTTGHEVRVTKVIHGKIQKGASFRTRDGKGSLNSQCQFNYMTAPAVRAAGAPVIINVPDTLKVREEVNAPQSKPAAGASNADRVRAYLAQAKADVGSEAFEKTVAWATTVLGMKAALARTYVKNNWSKV